MTVRASYVEEPMTKGANNKKSERLKVQMTYKDKSSNDSKSQSLK